MPTENARKRARKLILLPSGDQMYVPVITEIDFIDLVGDPSAQAVRWAVGQEFDYTVDNTAASGRKVHVDELDPIDVNADGTPTDPNNPPTPGTDPSQQLAVERIDTWPIVDPVQRGQEFDFNPDNKTGSDKQPPSFTTHEKTHIYRYYQDPMNPDDGGVWIDSELIDQWGFVDGPNRGQESEFALNNQTNAQFQGGDLSGQADPNDPDITIGGGTDGDGTSGEGTMDNPVRLDPFQNIVNFNGVPPTFQLNLTGMAGWDSSGSFDPSGIEPPPIPEGTSYNNSWLTNWSFTVTSEGGRRGSFGPGPPVSASPNSGSFSKFQYVGTGVNSGDLIFTGSSSDGGDLGVSGPVTGPPLVVGGRTIAGFVATLSISMSLGAFPYDFSNGTTGYYTIGNEVTAGSFTITVDSSPFTFNGTSFRAVGLKETDAFVGGNLQIYCVVA